MNEKSWVSGVKIIEDVVNWSEKNDAINTKFFTLSVYLGYHGKSLWLKIWG